MSTIATKKSPITPAHILNSRQDNGRILLTVPCIYGGGNQLRFVCPRCSTIHAHGAGLFGGAADGATRTPHCDNRAAHFKGVGDTEMNSDFYWKLQELLEGDDLSLAGDLDPIADVICPRRKDEPGYDQIGQGCATTRKLIEAYTEQGVTND